MTLPALLFRHSHILKNFPPKQQTTLTLFLCANVGIYVNQMQFLRDFIIIPRLITFTSWPNIFPEICSYESWILRRSFLAAFREFCFFWVGHLLTLHWSRKNLSSAMPFYAQVMLVLDCAIKILGWPPPLSRTEKTWTAPPHYVTILAKSIIFNFENKNLSVLVYLTQKIISFLLCRSWLIFLSLWHLS